MDPRARNVVSYADLADSTPVDIVPASSATPQKPAKRARLDSSPSSSQPQSFSGGATKNGVNGGNSGNSNKKRKKEKWETSRVLTHEEIWDDSALVEAWESAMEEYKALNGPGKGWLEGEPKKKSPLWYNTQPAEEDEDDDDEADQEEVVGEDDDMDYDDEYTTEQPGGDSRPVDFDTFVPSHDASLRVPPISLPVPLMPALPQAAGQVGSSPEEVLQMAMQSYYTAGYYMGVYSELQRTRTPAAVPREGDSIPGNPAATPHVGEEDAVEEIVTQR